MILGSIVYSLFSNIIRPHFSWPCFSLGLLGMCHLGVGCTTAKETDSGYTNIPPYSPIVTVSPFAPNTEDILEATLLFDTEDPDGNPVSLFFTWYKDGVVQQITGNEVPHSLTQKGEVWSIEAYTSDGSLDSSAVQVSTTIRNTPPAIHSTTYSSLSPTSVEDLQIIDIQTYDADEETVRLSISWMLNNEAVPELEDSMSVSYEFTQKEQQWTALITPSDRDDAGESHSVIFTIQNTPPEVTHVQITPEEAKTDSTLSADITSTDADQDELTYIYDWQVNNVSVSSSETLTENFFVRGDIIVLRVTADDGTNTSSSVESQAIQIANSAPQLDTLSIEPTQAYTNNPLTCSVTNYTDLDGDPIEISYEWFVNGVFVANGAVLSETYFQKDDIIDCTTIISDQLDEDTASTSITIQNSAPIAQSISLTSPATTEDILYCEVESTDLDEDIIIHEYSWFVDSTLITHNNSFLNATHPSFGLVPDNEVYCTATPTDVSTSGNTLTSSTTTLLPAYIDVMGTLRLGDYPVSGVSIKADTLPVLESMSSLSAGTYSLSVPTLSAANISALVENSMSPQVFSVDIAQGSSQTHDITFLNGSFPDILDHFEPDNGFSDSNNFSDSMQSSEINIDAPLQYRTLFPAGEEDWVSVSLSNQESYSIVATFLHHTSSVIMFVYDDQGNQVALSSSYLGSDSVIDNFTPPHTGEYFIMVDTIESNDIASYMLGVLRYEDNDSDGHNSFYDCDDTEATTYPNAPEIYQDAVDQDCDGIDILPPELFDDTEALGVNHFEPIPHRQIDANIRIYGEHQSYSLHSSSDIDRFTLSVPAKSKLSINNHIYEESTIRIEVLDGNLLLGSYTSDDEIVVYNPSSINTSLTIYVRNNIVGTAVNYSLSAHSYGTDNDLDGYYSQDLHSIRDLDDSDPAIHP